MVAKHIKWEQDLADISKKTEKHNIYIIGRNGMNNELLLYFLEQETDPSYNCSLQKSLSLLDTEKTKSIKKLVLCNCQDAYEQEESNDCERHLSAAPPDCYWACINVSHDHKVAQNAISNGVNGIFYENDSLATLRKGIQAIFNGELWFSRDTLSSTLSSLVEHKNAYRSSRDASEGVKLTRREKEILKLIALGKTNDEIADSLNISILTVKTHVSNIYAKINVPNRIQAIFWATKNFLHLKD